MKKQKTEYEIQAETFLEETDTTLTALHTGHRPYFPGDKEHRATFQITLTNKCGSYSFQFGQSIVDSYMLYTCKPIPRDEWNCAGVKDAQQTGRERSYYTPKGRPLRHIRLRKRAPNAYDILACLQTYDPGSFAEFCSDMGYDEDSRQAETTWRAVVDEFRGLDRIFDDKELMRLAEIS